MVEIPSKGDNMANTKKSSSAKKTTKAVSRPKTVKKSEPKKSTKIIQTENSYGHTILAAILIIVVLVGGYLGVQYKKTHGDGNYVATADEKKFKNEYESLNNVEKNKAIEIMSDNNIEYISMDKAASILDSGSGVIYFGFAGCPWCRNAVPVLLNAMKSTELDKIYYVNVRPDSKPENDLRDTYTLDSRNKAKKTRDAKESYYQVLLALANNLGDYVLTTSNGKKVNTGEKRLYAPTVVVVKKGEVIGFHEGTFDGHDMDKNGNLPDLTKDQENQLLSVYTKMISKYQDDNCNEENC